MAGDEFTRDLIAWQNQVVADRGLTLLAFHVAYVIAQHVNRGTGDAWPSQVRIADALKVTSRAVRKTVDQLTERGHLSVTVRHGRGDSNRYRLLRKTGTTVPLSEPENRNGGSCIPQGNRNDGSKETGTAVPTNHLREPTEGYSIFPSNSDFEAEPQIEADRSPQASPLAAAKPNRTEAVSHPRFDEWWQAYPRRIGKADARRAFDRALKAGIVTAEELIQGAHRFAAEREGEDPKFTPYPATWLNDGRWADEPTPRRRQSTTGRRAYSALARLMEDDTYDG